MVLRNRLERHEVHRVYGPTIAPWNPEVDESQPALYESTREDMAFSYSLEQSPPHIGVNFDRMLLLDHFKLVDRRIIYRMRPLVCTIRAFFRRKCASMSALGKSLT